ncbi:cellulase [Penicillium malachiteum]|uniref:Cellulase n=1 Tax=Penicillium malachiteum TaxID=1324776 RepID=A0AAD6HPK6_9EURO|nr:cellulase [Penicillium malachiteum]
MHDMEMNVVRLGHPWAGAEPIRGEYNQTFLDIMNEQTKLAEDHRIYVLVDVHQDKLARQFCGHGVPDWFVEKDWMPNSSRSPAPLTKPCTTDSGGFPSPTAQCEQFPWEMHYGTYAASNAFGRLYSNHDGLGMHSQPNGRGYNLLNEPWAGDVWANPLLWGFGVADHMVLEEVWNRAAKEIHKVENDTLIWFEGTAWDIKSGFNDVPLGDGSKTVHSFHYYHPPQAWSIWNTLKNRDIDNQRLKTAGVFTELTFWYRDGSEPKDLADAMRATDAHMVSWMGWGYEDLYDSSGQPKPELAKQNSRPYPAAVAGKAYSYDFEELLGTFTLKFRSDPDMDAPTEIIMPPSTFPKKPFIAIEPEGSMEEYQKDNRTLALFTSKSLQTPMDIKVIIQVRK